MRHGLNTPKLVEYNLFHENSHGVASNSLQSCVPIILEHPVYQCLFLGFVRKTESNGELTKQSYKLGTCQSGRFNRYYKAFHKLSAKQRILENGQKLTELEIAYQLMTYLNWAQNQFHFKMFLKNGDKSVLVTRLLKVLEWPL